MNWIITIVMGGIVGWLGSMVMKTNAQMGIIANVIVGIIGSSLGSARRRAGAFGGRAHHGMGGGGDRRCDPDLPPEGARDLHLERAPERGRAH